jgi:hypothetical protein
MATDTGDLVAGEIVHHDDIRLPQLRDYRFFACRLLLDAQKTLKGAACRSAPALSVLNYSDCVNDADPSTQREDSGSTGFDLAQSSAHLKR